MKIAATDYDGTLFRNGTISRETIESIRRWRQHGHKFGVISGRDYGMLVPQLRYYGVEFDYTVCNNGAIIRDAEGMVRYRSTIPAEALTAMVREPVMQESFHFAFSDVDATYLCHEFEGSWIMREAREWDFPIVEICEESIGELPAIHQLSLGFKKPDSSNACAAVLNRKYGEQIHAHPNACSLDVTPAEVNKQQGLEILMEVMGWQGAEVFAIGDETNDLPMLNAFGGYTVDTAREAIKKEARAVFKSVGAMLEHYAMA